MIEYSSCEKKYKSRVGAVAINEPLAFFVYGDANSVAVIMTKEGEGNVPVRYEMTKSCGRFETTITITTSGLYFYRFDADGVSYGSDEMCRATEGGSDFLQVAFEGRFRPLGGEVIYQIFPDRFYGGRLDEEWYSVPPFAPDENGRYNTHFYGGTIDGIIEKLDYIKSLNATHIYLNPVFSSPSSHRYDTSDYEKIDYRLGSEEDLRRLVAAAKERGMGIILDGVFSHTGDDSKYFDRYGVYGGGACDGKDSPYYEWYEFYDYPANYRCWWGIPSLPEVDELCPSYIEYMLGEKGIVKKWESLGIVGWRLDVADELPSEFLDRLREVSGVTLIGEVWENAARKTAYGKRRRYCINELDGVTDYPVRSGIIDFLLKRDNTALRASLREMIADYPSEWFSSMMNVLDTHDTVRILTALSDGELPTSKEERASVRHDEIARKRLKIAALIQYFLPGVPCLFYGDEAGLSGCEDPFCRRAYPWGKEDEELIAYYRDLGELRRKYADCFAGGAEERSPSKDVFVLDRTGDKKLTLFVDLSVRSTATGEASSDCGHGVVTADGEVVFDTSSGSVMAKKGK